MCEFSPVRLCDPVDCSSPGCSVHGICRALLSFPTQRLKLVVSCISCTAGGFFTAEPSRIRLTMVKMHLTTRVKSWLSMFLLLPRQGTVCMSWHRKKERGHSSVYPCGHWKISPAFRVFSLFLLPPSLPPFQLWNPCFKIKK